MGRTHHIRNAGAIFEIDTLECITYCGGVDPTCTSVESIIQIGGIVLETDNQALSPTPSSPLVVAVVHEPAPSQ
jgi:hypothetical protein